MTGESWIVAGGGLVALALAAARQSRQKGDVLLVRPPPQPPRGRHYALNENSARFLASINAMPPVFDVRGFHLHIGNNKNPAVKINAAEAGLSRLCAIAREEDLMPALEKAAAKAAQVIEENRWQQCHSDDSGIVLTAAGGGKKGEGAKEGKNYRGRFLAVADGANSAIACLLGVHCSHYSFQQTALTATVNAETDIDCAAQWFDDNDTLALLPLLPYSSGGGAFSLIWSLPNNKAQYITDSNITAAATKRTGINIKVESKITAYPLIARRRAVRALPNVVFTGDSAATIHPLAGQGLNLGFADAAQLAMLKDGDDLSPYLRRRQNRADIWDAITRSLCRRKTAGAAFFAAARLPLLRGGAARFANLF